MSPCIFLVALVTNEMCYEYPPKLFSVYYEIYCILAFMYVYTSNRIKCKGIYACQTISETVYGRHI